MIMHTSFAAGIFATALFTTILLRVLGNGLWQLIVFLWTLLPLYNAFSFIKAPLPGITPEEKRMKIREILKNKIFIFGFLAIFFGASTEILIIQWGSSYLEVGLGLPKAVGDVVGMCLFAAMLALGRLLYAKKGAGFNLNNLMILGSFICIICYIIVAAAPYAWMVLLAFGLIGFFSSLLWTGTLVVASDNLPHTGTIIFAFLAGGGDLGTAVLGQIIGWASDSFAVYAPAGINAAQFGLRAALALAVLVPVFTLVFQVILKRFAPHRN
jgi:hypothetical protein